MNQGFLAISSDVDPAGETDYLHWLTREHAAERLALPGFLAMRVFRAQLENCARFFIFYRLQDAAALNSAAYLARLNAPTAWSQRIMPRLENFGRSGGAIVQESGSGEGGFALALPFEAAALPRYRAALDELSRCDRIAAARLLVSDAAVTAAQTAEKAMRKGDASFAALLLLEGFDGEALHAAAAQVGAKPAGGAVYRQIFARR